VSSKTCHGFNTLHEPQANAPEYPVMQPSERPSFFEARADISNFLKPTKDTRHLLSVD
jgi:hypothetical protein